jgi:hypothetical protein
MESAISTSLLARRHQNGLPALTFHHVFAIVPDRGFDGIRDLDKLARPQTPDGLPALTLHQKPLRPECRDCSFKSSRATTLAQ